MADDQKHAHVGDHRSAGKSAEEPSKKRTCVRPPIKFFSEKGMHGFLSNFWKCDVSYAGRVYPTSEHAYQAHKFLFDDAPSASLELAALIQLQNTPYKAKILSMVTPPRRYAWQRALADKVIAFRKDGATERPGWYDMRVATMHAIVLAKFQGNQHCNDALLATEGCELIEASPTDAFWGAGRDGKGRNELGSILMQVRAQLRKTPSSEAHHGGSGDAVDDDSV